MVFTKAMVQNLIEQINYDPNSNTTYHGIEELSKSLERELAAVGALTLVCAFVIHWCCC